MGDGLDEEDESRVKIVSEGWHGTSKGGKIKVNHFFVWGGTSCAHYLHEYAGGHGTSASLGMATLLVFLST